MHIPDGYLGPKTYGTLYAAMIPAWYWCSRRVHKTLKAREVPSLALAAAFSFVLMMFNVPVPGGTTGHAVGGALVAILLGPCQAVLVLTIDIVIQALLFGDGGVTAIGANCFNMALVMPIAGYFLFHLLKGKAADGSRRATLAAGAAAYLSLSLAALFAGVELGIQPLIAVSATGTPLYNPYPLKVAVPAMVGEHMLFFGWAEAIVTALVYAYVVRHQLLPSIREARAS